MVTRLAFVLCLLFAHPVLARDDIGARGAIGGAIVYAGGVFGGYPPGTKYCFSNKKVDGKLVGAWYDPNTNSIFFNPAGMVAHTGVASADANAYIANMYALHEMAHAIEYLTGNPVVFGPSPPYIGGPYNTKPRICGEIKLQLDVARKSCEEIERETDEKKKAEFCSAYNEVRENYKEKAGEAWSDANCSPAHGSGFPGEMPECEHCM